MQAIQTKVLPATDTKPTRIKAQCARGSIVIAPYLKEYSDMSEQAHRFVVERLVHTFALSDLKEYGTPIDGNPLKRPFVSGCLPNGDYCHVFTH